MAESLYLENLTDSTGRRFDAVVADGLLWLRGWPAAGLRRLDARGGRLLPGLTDHHMHLMATAAARESLDLSEVSSSAPDLTDRLREAARHGPVRGIGLDGAERLDADILDTIAPDVPLRIQARTGGLWVLNRAALSELGPEATLPPSAERGPNGRLTGRIWRDDALLRQRAAPPDLRGIGADLARWGVTGVTDASVTTDAAQAELLARSGLQQRLTLMSGGPLPPDPRWRVGPVKIAPDERDLPDFTALTAIIQGARAQGRNVAVHCVTHAELALVLAALGHAGAWPGDRIEHGALIGTAALPVLAELGLTVAANPGFVVGRGDRWLAQVPGEDRSDLCRLASVAAAGVALLAGSDAPYGPANPWECIRAAWSRRTAGGAILGPDEALKPEAALALHLPPAGADPRHGDPADLAVLCPGARPGCDTDPVALTLIGGAIAFNRHSPGAAA